MSKKAIIIAALKRGERDDEKIAAEADSTVNSVRWYRSKMNTGALDGKAAPPQVRVVSDVATAAKELGLEERIRKGVEEVIDEHRLMREPGEVYDRLRLWNYVVNGRATSRYGYCRADTEEIEVNEVLLRHPVDLEQTFLHEVAHALEWILFRPGGHGFLWKELMYALGLPPRVVGGHTQACRDDFKEQRVSKRAKRVKFIWTCQRCGHESKKFRKSKYPVSQYYHRRCGGRYEERRA